MKKNTIFVFFVFFTQSIIAQTEMPQQSFDIYGGKIINQNFTTKISFDFKEGLILIPVSIEDTSVNFIFDSAASISVIDKAFYSKHKRAILGQRHVSDVNGNSDSLDVVEYDSCRINDLKIEKMPFVISDMRKSMKNNDIVGIVGANIINKLNWFIDYDLLELTTTDKDLSGINNENIITRLNIDFTNDHVPFVKLKIGSEVIGNCKLDLGSVNGIWLSKEMFEKVVNLRHSSVKKYISQNNSGLFVDNNAYENSYCSIENYLKIDKYRVPYIVLYSPINSPLIGQKFLSRFNIGIDYKNKAYNLYKRKNIQYDTLEPIYPIAFNWKDNQITVRHTKLCSDIDNYGVNIGDEVETINEKKASNFKNGDDFIAWYREEKSLLIKFKKYDKAITIRKEKNCR